MGDPTERPAPWVGEDLDLVLSILDRAHMTFWAGAGAEDNYAIRLWNPGAEQIYGHSREQAIGNSYIDLFVNPSERPRAIEDHARIVANDETYDWDWAADDLTKDGEVRTMLTHCFPVQDPKDGAWLLAEIGIDISDFNKASQQLRKLREDEFEKRELTLAKGIGEIGQAVTQVGGDGTFTLVTTKVFSAVADAVTGVARCTIWIKDGAPSGPKRYDDPSSISTIQVPFDEKEALQLVLKSGQSIISDSKRRAGTANSVRRAERRNRNRAFALVPLRGIRDRALLGAIGITLRGSALSDRDETRLETLAAFTGPLLAVAQELQQTREGEVRRLRAATKQQIFRSVLHTLGGDIFQVRGRLETIGELQRRSDVPADVRGLLLDLRERIDRLNTSLSDLRLHIETDDRQELVSVSDAVAEVVNPLRINYLDIEFQVDVDPEHTVFMVRGWLHHILQNLLTNAAQVLMQAYRGGHVLVRSVRTGEDRVEIHIEDSGPGVDASISGSLFEKGVTQREGGTGEGLFIALDLAVSSGGNIVLSSRPSPRLGGAHFRVELPTRREAA